MTAKQNDRPTAFLVEEIQDGPQAGYWRIAMRTDPSDEWQELFRGYTSGVEAVTVLGFSVNQNESLRC